MYTPRHYEAQDLNAVHALMHAHPFATVVAQTAEGFDATHIPFLFDASTGEHGTLRGHVARANPIWHTVQPGSEVLVIFQGADAYITPSWYPVKQEHGKVVPTWNYAAVHAYGTLRAIEDPAWLHDMVSGLTDRHEAGRAQPWKLADAPADYTAAMLKAIVGLEITVTRLVGKWKVSQNRPEADRDGVVEGLLADGDRAMAALVRQGGV